MKIKNTILAGLMGIAFLSSSFVYPTFAQEVCDTKAQVESKITTTYFPGSSLVVDSSDKETIHELMQVLKLAYKALEVPANKSMGMDDDFNYAMMFIGKVEGVYFASFVAFKDGCPAYIYDLDYDTFLYFVNQYKNSLVQNGS